MEPLHIVVPREQTCFGSDLETDAGATPVSHPYSTAGDPRRQPRYP